MARRICPQCGSRETAKILYGMPTWSPELDEQINKGGIVLGGCCITRCDPVYRCNKCKKDFGAPTADLEADTTSFYFSLGGYFDGYQSVTVTKIDNGAVMIYTPGYALESETIEKQLSTDEWLSFIHSLYRCYITDWKKRYVDPHVLDGTQWELIVSFLNGKSLKIHGSNRYPIHWTKLLKTIKILGVSMK
ncbi:MAG: hypothetical protein AB7E31_15125 [Desulfitobacterium sp.]